MFRNHLNKLKHKWSLLSKSVSGRIGTFIFLSFFVALYFDTPLMLYNNRIINDNENFAADLDSSPCNFPNIQPLPKEFKKFIFHMKKPNCLSKQKNKFRGNVPFYVMNGSSLVRNSNLNASTTSGCCYRPIYRVNESKIRLSSKCIPITRDVTFVPHVVEYIEINCKRNGNNFRDGLALVPRKPLVDTRISEFKSKYPDFHQNSLNVIYLFLESTSQMNFLRWLDKSQDVLNLLSAVSLEGFTKVGDNSYPNLMPVLTGHTFEEFKEICTNGKLGKNVYLDKCQFIWKVFSAMGYRTSLAEDDIWHTIGNKYWPDAFLKPPVDYYWRPLALHFTKSLVFNDDCFGSKLINEKMFDYLKSFAEVFGENIDVEEHKPFFQFNSIGSKLTHGFMNKLKWTDEPLVELLDYFQTSGILNRTAIFLVGDHGQRDEKVRKTRQGNIEYKMPAAYIVLPDWFQTKFRKSYDNLVYNSKQLTSHFDIHKMFYDLIDLRRLENVENGEKLETTFEIVGGNQTINLGVLRGISLFEKVPNHRTCQDAGIPLHWCSCYDDSKHPKIPLDLVKDGAKYIIQRINLSLKPYPMCRQLQLKSVDQVKAMTMQDIRRELCSRPLKTIKPIKNENVSKISTVEGLTTDELERICKMGETVIVMQIRLSAVPGNGRFEAVVVKIGDDGDWRLDGEIEDIVRLSWYKAQGKCSDIIKVRPNCFCGKAYG